MADIEMTEEQIQAIVNKHMSKIASKKTERKSKSSAENLAKVRDTPEYRANLKAAQQRRREREQAQKEP